MLLHQICQNQIHLELSEANPARSFNAAAALQSHAALARFIRWVAKRPPDFYDIPKRSRRPYRRYQA